MRTPLVDGDILRYEIGFAAETAWEHMKGNGLAPPFDLVEEILLNRLGTIYEEVDGENPEIFLTDGPSFRESIAKSKVYKGNRSSQKPWHYDNLTVYLRDILGAKTVEGIEADDAMALRQLEDPEEPTIICSRDKDLRQVPGWFYSWELGNQPSFGPEKIKTMGWLEMRPGSPKKLFGVGISFFYAQCLMGDTVDNIPGLKGYGPVKVYDLLSECKNTEEMLSVVMNEYEDVYGKDYMEHLLEQGRLLWMTREMKDGKPVLWSPGMGN